MVERSSNYPETRKSKYTLNHHFFDVIDTEEKAYWLGFITADGCIHVGADGKRRVSVQLADYDANHLQKMARDFGSDQPVRCYSKRSEAVIVFSSLPLVRSLDLLGVGPRKSGVVKPWDGPAVLLRHYWRGMVDGDGTICPCRTRNKWTVGLCGSVHCVVGFANWARVVTGSKAVPQQRPNSQLCWSWQVTGTWAPQRLVDELYSNATVFLDRKMELANHLMATRYQNPPKT
jgi:hypothetical protein